MKELGGFMYTILCVATAMIGYNIHNDIFWAIVDFLFMPIVWCKWLIYEEVNISIIEETFEFLFK